jgi:hypothetical protein
MHPRSLISTLLQPAFTIQDTLGALSIGALVSLFLFGAITLQVYMYLIHFQNDNRNLKMLVSATYSQRYLARSVLYIYLNRFPGGLRMVRCFGSESFNHILLSTLSGLASWLIALLWHICSITLPYRDMGICPSSSIHQNHSESQCYLADLRRGLLR